MVLHGPEIFDSGSAERLFRLVGPRRVVVAGVMARTAAEESGLPCEFPGLPPSMILKALEGPSFLVNQGKSAESGRIFGEIIAARLGNAGLIHVECSSPVIFCWNRPADRLARELSRRTGVPLQEVRSSSGAPVPGTRTIRGCIPGEAVYVNGVVIGHAMGDSVVLGEQSGSVVPLSGLIEKSHGLEKLRRTGPLDISRAWCKSGRLRSKAPVRSRRMRKCGKVVLVDHCGHHLYHMLEDPDICGIVSVGDDTTAVCGHIGTHLGIPVLGIVDGDSDNIVPASFAPGSVTAMAEGESDDDIGKEIAALIPAGDVEWDEFVARVADYLGERVKISRVIRT